jgi:hypothetical protein
MKNFLPTIKHDGGRMNQVQAELERFRKDTGYYEAHHEELLEKYPEQWVAIFDQQVVGAGPDYEQLLTELGEKGVPIERALFKHLTQKEELWILIS